jgi:hypothetical protein
MSAARRPGSGVETTSAKAVRNPPASVSGNSIRSSGTRVQRRIATGPPTKNLPRAVCVLGCKCREWRFRSAPCQLFPAKALAQARRCAGGKLKLARRSSRASERSPPKRASRLTGKGFVFRKFHNSEVVSWRAREWSWLVPGYAIRWRPSEIRRNDGGRPRRAPSRGRLGLSVINQGGRPMMKIAFVVAAAHRGADDYPACYSGQGPRAQDGPRRRCSDWAGPLRPLR